MEGNKWKVFKKGTVRKEKDLAWTLKCFLNILKKCVEFQVMIQQYDPTNLSKTAQWNLKTQNITRCGIKKIWDLYSEYVITEELKKKK